MDSEFDPDRLRLLPSMIASPTLTRPRRKTTSGKGNFIMGPLYLTWIGAAARLPGRSLNVALLVAYRAGMARTAEFVIPGTDLPIFNLDRFSFGRGLKFLERAGLVVATRGAGRKPRVRMLAPADIGHQGAGGHGS